jgi:chromosome segregation ATPase
MSPLATKILLSLCGTFIFGTFVGWLAKQISVRFSRQKERKRWEEQLRQRQENLTAARDLIHKQAEAIQGLQEQFTGANSTLKNFETRLATAKKELKVKVTELADIEAKRKEAEEKAAQSDAALAEEQQLAGRIEEEVRTLRQDSVNKAETNMQLTQQLEEQDNLAEKLREQEATYRLNRSRLEFTLRAKENELQQVQQRLAATAAQQTQLLEKNRNLSHSCARYQTDLHTAAETIERLRAELSTLGQGEPSADSPTLQLPFPDIREQMKAQEKDEEVARLRARVAGLQLLLRHGVGQPRPHAGGVPVVVDQAQK